MKQYILRSLRFWSIVVVLTFVCSRPEHIYSTHVNRNPTVVSTSTKQLLVQEINQYINKKFPKSQLGAEVIVEKCVEHNFDPVFLLAQGVIESGLGTAGMARKSKSVWNVGASDGASIQRIAGKYKYKTMDDAVEPYILLVKKKYKGNKSFSELMNRYVTLKGKHRYAQDPNYERTLKNQYKVISNQTKIDEYWKALH